MVRVVQSLDWRSSLCSPCPVFDEAHEPVSGYTMRRFLCEHNTTTTTDYYCVTDISDLSSVARYVAVMIAEPAFSSGESRDYRTRSCGPNTAILQRHFSISCATDSSSSTCRPNSVPVSKVPAFHSPFPIGLLSTSTHARTSEEEEDGQDSYFVLLHFLLGGGKWCRVCLSTGTCLRDST